MGGGGSLAGERIFSPESRDGVRSKEVTRNPSSILKAFHAGGRKGNEQREYGAGDGSSIACEYYQK